MANPWFRLWGDMVNDPKWRTIAKVSKQRIGDVLSVYLHMMTLASNATERGRTEGWNDEDIGTALDIETEQVAAIREAMQGRVLDGDFLTGWAKRQPAKEDGAAERARQWREDKKAKETGAAAAATQAIERSRTQPNATERQIRGEERREEITSKALVPGDAGAAPLAPVKSASKPDCPHQAIIEIYHEVLPQCPRIRDWTPSRQQHLRARWNEDARRQDLDYWRRFFEYVATCDFLVGKGGKSPFFADLEWIVTLKNFTKIREEKYANRKAA